MLEPANLLKIAHAVVGVWFIAGLIGRWVTLGQAARTTEIAPLQQLLMLSSRFERMVVLGSFGVLGLGIATAIAQGRPFLGPLAGAPADWLFISLVLFLSVLPLIPLVFLPRGRAFDAALDAAVAEGSVTDRLRAALGDRVLLAAHAYELGVMLIVLVLMIAKPF